MGAGVLLERSEELGALRGHIERAASARGSVCLIEGAAGIGKTALLDACAELAAGIGVRALRARAGPLEQELGWNLVRQLFSGVIAAPEQEREGLLAGAASLAAPALGLAAGSDAGGARSGSLHGLYWLTVALAQQGPLLLAVDDAQWGDRRSLEYLAYVGERAGDLPVCVVVAVRYGEDDAGPLTAISARHDTEVLRPGELSAEGSGKLVRAALGAGAAHEFCRACHAATGGNPFLLHELLGQLSRDRVPPSGERAADVAGITPETVRRTVLLRLARLPGYARELASALSVLGDGARLADAERLAGLDKGEGARAADTLAAAGILQVASPLAFVHPLVREVVYGAVALHERAQRHKAAARLLWRTGADAERVAAQLLQSEPNDDPWVVERLREAAQAALAQGATSTAADVLERALREPPPALERPQVLREFGGAELAAGRPGGAEHLRQAAETLLEPSGRAQTLLELGGALYTIGEHRQAAEALERGLGEVAQAGAEHASLAGALLAAWLGVARTEVPLRARASELLHEIAARPPRGESYGERALLAQLAGQLTFEGEPREQSLELARAAVADGDLIRQDGSDGITWVAAAGALGWGGDFDAYEALQGMALDDARRRGSVTGFASASYGYSFSHYYRGMLSDAIADAEQAIAAEREGWQQFLLSARAQLAWALIEQDELDAAATQLELASRDTTSHESAQQALVLDARARLHLARGEWESALEAAVEAGRIVTDALVPNPSIVSWRSRAAIAAARLGRHEQAESLIEEELRLARRFGAPRPIGIALIAAGIIRGRRGIDALEEAVYVLKGSPARLEHARALVHHGAALRHRGSLTAAREILASGLEESVACQSVVLERHARHELLATGARPRRSELRGAGSLTPAELRVAGLAAQDMSNREIAEALFVSLRTVETHLTHAYQKLEIGSRGTLAAALAPPTVR